MKKTHRRYDHENFSARLRPVGNLFGLVSGPLRAAGFSLRPARLRTDGGPAANPLQRRDYPAPDRGPHSKPGKCPGTRHPGGLRRLPKPAEPAAGDCRPHSRPGKAPGAVHEGPGNRHGQTAFHHCGGGAARRPGCRVAGAGPCAGVHRGHSQLHGAGQPERGAEGGADRRLFQPADPVLLRPGFNWQ